MRTLPLLCVSMLCLVASACGGGSSSPTAPTASGPPAVNGTYSGTTTFAAPSLGTSFTCAATTTVNQSGYQLSIAPVLLSGGSSCNGQSIPVGSVSIDNTGSFGTVSTVVQIQSCSYNAVASGGFFGRTLQASFAYTSPAPGCPTLNITFNLTKQ